MNFYLISENQRWVDQVTRVLRPICSEILQGPQLLTTPTQLHSLSEELESVGLCILDPYLGRESLSCGWKLGVCYSFAVPVIAFSTTPSRVHEVVYHSLIAAVESEDELLTTARRLVDAMAAGAETYSEVATELRTRFLEQNQHERKLRKIGAH